MLYLPFITFCAGAVTATVEFREWRFVILVLALTAPCTLPIIAAITYAISYLVGAGLVYHVLPLLGNLLLIAMECVRTVVIKSHEKTRQAWRSRALSGGRKRGEGENDADADANTTEDTDAVTEFGGGGSGGDGGCGNEYSDGDGDRRNLSKKGKARTRAPKVDAEDEDKCWIEKGLQEHDTTAGVGEARPADDTIVLEDF